MPKITFDPNDLSFEVAEKTKILAAALRNKVDIRYGCGACQCGTCAVAVAPTECLSPMSPAEHALLDKMTLPVDGSIRLSCQTRVVSGEVKVDLSFQDKYSPDKGLF